MSAIVVAEETMPQYSPRDDTATVLVTARQMDISSGDGMSLVMVNGIPR